MKKKWLALLLLLTGCAVAPPEGVTPVTGFELNRYLGQWYEIARLDHSFERGLSDVSATYRLQDDGSVQVVNRGFDGKRNEWREAVGRALFTGDPTRASLKEPFFGPFYGGYQGWVSLEMEDLTMSVDAGVTTSIDALKQTISQ